MRKNKDEMLIHEVAQLFGNSTGAIREWAKAGVLRCDRANNGYRIFNRQEVYQLYEKSRVNGEGKGHA